MKQMNNKPLFGISCLGPEKDMGAVIFQHHAFTCNHSQKNHFVQIVFRDKMNVAYINLHDLNKINEQRKQTECITDIIFVELLSVNLHLTNDILFQYNQSGDTYYRRMPTGKVATGISFPTGNIFSFAN